MDVQEIRMVALADQMQAGIESLNVPSDIDPSKKDLLLTWMEKSALIMTKDLTDDSIMDFVTITTGGLFALKNDKDFEGALEKHIQDNLSWLMGKHNYTELINMLAERKPPGVQEDFKQQVIQIGCDILYYQIVLKTFANPAERDPPA